MTIPECPLCRGELELLYEGKEWKLGPLATLTGVAVRYEAQVTYKASVLCTECDYSVRGTLEDPEADGTTFTGGYSVEEI